MEHIRSIEPSIIQLGNTESIGVTVTTERGVTGSVQLPAGISVGASEAQPMLPAAAVQAIRSLVTPALQEIDVLQQRLVDDRLLELAVSSGSDASCGASALLPVSLAVARVAAATLQRELYVHLADLGHSQPTIPETIQVIVEGGKHAPTSGLSVQEFSFIGSVTDGTRLLQLLRSQLDRQANPATIGPEGGLVASFQSNLAVLELLSTTAEEAHLAPRFALDVAASHGDTPIATLQQWLAQYPIEVIEDPVDQADLTGWQQFTRQFGRDHLVAADDLTVGDPVRIKDAVRDAVANCLVIKLGQTSTLSELFDLIALVQVGGWAHIVSHRGLETNDTFIADLAVATGARYLKAGTTQLEQRRVKYERLATIATQLAVSEH